MNDAVLVLLRDARGLTLCIHDFHDRAFRPILCAFQRGGLVEGAALHAMKHWTGLVDLACQEPVKVLDDPRLFACLVETAHPAAAQVQRSGYTLAWKPLEQVLGFDLFNPMDPIPDFFRTLVREAVQETLVPSLPEPSRRSPLDQLRFAAAHRAPTMLAHEPPASEDALHEDIRPSVQLPDAEPLGLELS